MRSAQTIIEMVRSRGERGLPIRRVYRLIRNRDLLINAYGKLYANEGALTAGVNPHNTVQGMSLARIEAIIDQLEQGTYQWQPTRRTEIPKKKGGKRPLGIPSWNDKLVQEVIKTVLEAYYEPQFSSHSHGYRPSRGCHTALQEVETWRGTKWFIEGDIKGCFDNIDHDVLLQVIGRQIQDARFLKLLKEMLQAGYVQDWQYHKTHSGTPQGGVVSPLLANIMLNELDKFVENELFPQCNKGQCKERNPAYMRLNWQMTAAKRRRDVDTFRQLRGQRRQIPSQNTHDPKFRRLKYVRYADDFLLGFIGTRSEAMVIKEKLAQFLQGIKLSLSHDKTLITHATESRARFLGYEIHIAQDNNRCVRHRQQAKRQGRSINGLPLLKVPRDVIQKWSARFSKNGKATYRPYLLRCSAFEITFTYGQEFQGLANYYALAHNVSSLYKVKFHYMRSLAKTLAKKFKRSLSWVYRKYKRKSEDGVTCLIVDAPNPNNPDKPLRAKFGYKSLKRNDKAIITDTITYFYNGRNELARRLLANKCELCGSSDRIRGHHVRKLKDVVKRYQGQRHPPLWAKFMMERRRKVVFVCHQCHVDIHAGRYDGQKVKARLTGKPRDTETVKRGLAGGGWKSAVA